MSREIWCDSAAYNKHICLECLKVYKRSRNCCGFPTTRISKNARPPKADANKKKWADFIDRFIWVRVGNNTEEIERIIKLREKYGLDVTEEKERIEEIKNKQKKKPLANFFKMSSDTTRENNLNLSDYLYEKLDGFVREIKKRNQPTVLLGNIPPNLREKEVILVRTINFFEDNFYEFDKPITKKFKGVVKQSRKQLRTYEVIVKDGQYKYRLDYGTLNDYDGVTYFHKNIVDFAVFPKDKPELADIYIYEVNKIMEEIYEETNSPFLDKVKKENEINLKRLMVKYPELLFKAF